MIATLRRYVLSLLMLPTMVCLAWAVRGYAQDFQIVWVIVGEAEANAGNRPARAGRHLFMAPDLMSLSLKNVKVSRVDVAPAVTQIPIGQRVCISSLSITAFDPDGGPLKNAPLSVSVRQDQKQRLALERNDADICVTPAAAGEYPIRFASLLPAHDGTTRGAQIFLRVAEGGNLDAPAADAHGPINLTAPPASSPLALRSH